MEATYDLCVDTNDDSWGYVGVRQNNRWHFLGFVRLAPQLRYAVHADGVPNEDGLVQLQLDDDHLRLVLSELVAAHQPTVTA